MGLGLMFGWKRAVRSRSIMRINGESGRSAVSSQLTGVGTDDGSSGEFGANEWLVDELYEQFVQDKNSVDKSWWPILENYHPAVADDSIPSPDETPAPTPAEPTPPTPSEPIAPAPAEPTAPTPSEPTPPAGGAPAPHPNEPKPVTTPIPIIGQQPVARTTSVAPKPQPVPADAPVTAPSATVEAAEEDRVTPLRGMSKTLATNMDASLSIPTA